MVDPRMTKWAQTLVNYSLGVKAGEVVGITGGVAAEPLLRATALEVVRAGGHPILLPTFGGTVADLLREGGDGQLRFVGPVERFLRTEADAMLSVSAETNTRGGAAVAPGRRRIYDGARAELRQTFLDRAAAGTLRWSSTIFPTDAYAQDAEMSTEEFADFVLGACKLNEPDPAAAWGRLRDDQQRLIDWLATKDEIRVVAPGTDLTLSVKGRTWINSDGHRNFPSGEIFTGPIETSATGTVRFSFPVVTDGREIADVRLRFAEGRVVEASAAKNEAYLIETLDSDPGARFLGEFAFGTNFDITRFTKNILLDEKIGGTVHMAVGAGYPDSGSLNRSAVHWDMICDLRQEGVVTVDGTPFLRGGRFLV